MLRWLNVSLSFLVHYWNRPSCLDIEWLLSTLFDASLLNFRAAGHGGSFSLCHFGPHSAALPPRRLRSAVNHRARKPGGQSVRKHPSNAACEAHRSANPRRLRLPATDHIKRDRGGVATMSVSSRIGCWTAR